MFTDVCNIEVIIRGWELYGTGISGNGKGNAVGTT